MKKHVISLFDYTGVFVQPWLEAGYTCWLVDIKHETSQEGPLHKIHWDLTTKWPLPVDPTEIAFCAAFPPCDHLAVSGARWFKGKGLRKLSTAIALFATATEICEETQAPYLIENPVSTISTYWRKPDYTFSPHFFTQHEVTDNYTKRTCLWSGGGFKFPPFAMLQDLGPPDDRIHKCPPSAQRAAFRSTTPLGFARAVFLSNQRHDEPAS